MAAVLKMLVVCGLVAAAAAAQPARRIKFAKCDYAEEETAKPHAVYMTCVNARGNCMVRLGGNHTLQAVFTPRMESDNIYSSVSWNNGFIPVALPGQDNTGCSYVTCPTQPNKVARFTYSLYIEPYFPAAEYPVIWRLTDTKTNTDVACWKFTINIVA